MTTSIYYSCYEHEFCHNTVSKKLAVPWFWRYFPSCEPQIGSLILARTCHLWVLRMAEFQWNWFPFSPGFVGFLPSCTQPAMISGACMYVPWRASKKWASVHVWIMGRWEGQGLRKVVWVCVGGIWLICGPYDVPLRIWTPMFEWYTLAMSVVENG